METEERLDRLEGAHRALAAQHLALQTTCRALLPLISANPALVKRVLLAAYDQSNATMDEDGLDEAFQRDMRRWLDVFCAEIHVVADISRQPPSSSGGKRQ